MRLIKLCIIIGIIASGWAGYEYLGDLAQEDAETAKQKITQQISILEPQATVGNVQAQFKLARLYMPTDPVLAARWMERAAHKGHSKSQFYFAQMLEMGKGVDRNLKTAALWYQRAANFGNDEDAQYALGRLYRTGIGVGYDPTEAIVWFKRAAQGGQPAAQYMVGRMFETGWGGRLDLIQSFAWYTLSNKQRSKALESAPSNDPQEALLRIGKLMNDSQREHARKMLKRGLSLF